MSFYYNTLYRLKNEKHCIQGLLSIDEVEGHWVQATYSHRQDYLEDEHDHEDLFTFTVKWDGCVDAHYFEVCVHTCGHADRRAFLDLELAAYAVATMILCQDEGNAKEIGEVSVPDGVTVEPIGEERCFDE